MTDSSLLAMTGAGSFAAGMFLVNLLLRHRLKAARLLEEKVKKTGPGEIGIPLKNLTVAVYLLGIVMAFIIYLIFAIFTIAYKDMTWVMLGGFIGIMAAALPSLRNMKLARPSPDDKEFREVPPHPAEVPFLAFKKESYVGLYILRSGKMHYIIGPARASQVTVAGKPYRIPREGERGGHIEFRGQSGVRSFLFIQGWSEPLKWPGYNQQVALEVKDGLRKLEVIREKIAKDMAGGASAS